MMSFKKILIAVLVTLLLGALVIVPIFSSHEEADNDPIAQFLIKDNLAMHLGDVIPLSIQLHDNKIDKIELFIQDSLLKSWNKPNGKITLSFDSKSYLLGTKSIRFLAYKKGTVVFEDARLLRILSDIAPLKMKANVISTLPHNPLHFTQGLEFSNGELFESTGQNGASIVAKINMQTGMPLSQIGLDATYFGEGITVINNKVYQLTWREQKCFVYDQKTLALESDMSYIGEGWGLCNNGKQLIMSDGSERLYFRNPSNFQVIKTIEVYDHFGPKVRLNELEFIDGKIYANVWMEDIILVIDPMSGKVLSEVDCADVILAGKNGGEVLNGIAYNSNAKKTYLTGKNWGKLVEVSIK